jgi:inorganic pyrophosphatase
MSVKVPVYIEIEKGSNIKYEFNKQTQSLEVDRMLLPPYVYPHAYGFIPNTLAADGDDLDALIIHDGLLELGKTYDAYIVDALRMEDEKGMDEKVICTLYDSSTAMDPVTLAEIETFFAEYKKDTPGKWSRTDGYMGHEAAVALYKASLI